MNLLVNSLKQAIDGVARAKHLQNYRVLDKTNARGEIVIALILPGERTGLPTRDEIKRARER